MAKLTVKKRKDLPSKDFAGPDRSYPINDESHARNALARVSEFGSSSEKAEIRAKVKRKFPKIKVKKWWKKNWKIGKSEKNSITLRFQLKMISWFIFGADAPPWVH